MTRQALRARIMDMPEKKTALIERFLPLLIILVVGLSFTVGFLWQRIVALEKGNTASNNKPSSLATEPPTNKLTDDKAKKVPQVTSSDHVRGSRDAQVFLVEYADLECPYCKTFHQVAKQALDAYPGKLAWVYRDFPLDMLHTKARTEAQATECVASLAGNEAFWKYVDKIYEVTPSNNQLEMTLLPQLAVQVGVDKTKFNSCLGSEEAKNTVELEYQGGVTAGVTGTPASFIINKKGEVWTLPGLVPFATMKETIEEALKG